MGCLCVGTTSTAAAGTMHSVHYRVTTSTAAAGTMVTMVCMGYTVRRNTVRYTVCHTVSVVLGVGRIIGRITVSSTMLGGHAVSIGEVAINGVCVEICSQRVLLQRKTKKE